MIQRIVAIVEGKGEVQAVPVLLRRITQELGQYPEILPPLRIPKTRLMKEGELERAVRAAGAIGGPGAAILVLVDADEDCPGTLGPTLLSRACRARPDRQIRVVLAKTEFEAWFLAAAESLRGKRGLRGDLQPPKNPEAVSGAKEWLRRNADTGFSYRPTLDQPALTQLFSLDQARRAPSFDKLWRDILSLFDDVQVAP